MSITQNIEKLFNICEDYRLIKNIQKNTRFYDEPFYYSYVLQLQGKPRHLVEGRYILNSDNVPVGGLSVESREKALIRCLGEAAERLCIYSFMPGKIQEVTQEYLQENINLHTLPNSVGNKKWGCVKGKNITADKQALLPAQLIFLNYSMHAPETLADVPISTGAACDDNYVSAVLTGILEVVERDAIMIAYLTKNINRHIDLEKIPSRKIQKILKKIRRYNLEWYVFDVQNNIPIPTYLSVLVDRTGFGPAVVVGSKTSLNTEVGIVASVEEAFMSRVWGRQIIQDMINPNLGQVRTRSDHLYFWLSPKQISKLDWLLSLPKQDLQLQASSCSREELLHRVVRNCQQKGFDIFAVDVTLDMFKEAGFYVTKVLIPGLQSLYFDEQAKELYINRARLQQLYGTTEYCNHVPHPFL